MVTNTIDLTYSLIVFCHTEIRWSNGVMKADLHFLGDKGQLSADSLVWKYPLYVIKAIELYFKLACLWSSQIIVSWESDVVDYDSLNWH